MKLAIVALVVFAAAAAQGTKTRDRPGYNYQHRQVTGHFKDRPFLDLYKVYTEAFLEDKGMIANDDYRRYTPSAEDCITFLDDYTKNGYQVKGIYDFIVVDACLGYLYQSEYTERDMENSEYVKQKLPNFIADDNLKNFFEGTKIESLDDEFKTCIANLLLNSVLIRHQIRDRVDGTDWIQLYLNFAECQNSIEREASPDTYLDRIYEMVRNGALSSYKADLRQINEQVRDTYMQDKLNRAKLFIIKIGSTMAKQEQERMWPRQIAKLFSVVQGVDKSAEINLREIHKLLRGFHTRDEQLKQKLYENIATYMTKVLAPKSSDKKDPTGANRYKATVDGLCRHFRSSEKIDHPKSMIRIIELLSYPKVFGLTEEEFLKDFLEDAYETAVIYLGISTCNILTYTEGHVVAPRDNTKPRYEVSLKNNPSTMVRWLVSGHY